MCGPDREIVVVDMIRAVQAGRGGVLLVDGEPGGEGPLVPEFSLPPEFSLAPEYAAASAGPGFSAGPRLSFSPSGTDVDQLLAPLARAWPELRTCPELRARPDLIALDDLECARMVLAPLDEDENAAAQLIADELGAAPERDLLEMAAAADGDPVLLAELLARLRDEDAIRISGGSASLTSGQRPQRLRTAVRRWLTDRGPRALRFLATGAVLGRMVQLDNAAAMLGEAPAVLLPARQAALAGSTGMLAAANAGMFAAAGASMFAAAGAGMFAAVPHTAAKLTARTLTAAGLADEKRISQAVTAVESRIAAMRLTEAADLARGALAGPVPAAAAARLRCCLSSVMLLGGQLAAAAEQAEQVLSEPGLTAADRDEAEFALLLGLSASAQATERLRARAAAILSGGTHREAAAVTGALLAEAVLDWREGRLSAALDFARQAVCQGAAGAASGSRIMSRLVLASLLIPAGCLEEAAEVISALSADAPAPDAPAPDAPSLDVPGRSAHAEILQAHLALAAGDSAEAVARAKSGLGLADAQGAGLLRVLGLSVLATVALRSGELRAAARHLKGCQAHTTAHGPGLEAARGLLLAAQVAQAREDTQTAARLADELISLAGRDRSVLLADCAAAAWLVRFALGRQDREHAEEVGAAADKLAAENPELPGVVAAAAHAGGLLTGDAYLLSRAAREHPDPWARASAAEDVGELLAESEDLGRAARSFETSLADYERTGAQRDALRVRLRLRGLGIARRQADYAGGSRPGWASLTDTERAVSDLIAHGLTTQKIAGEMLLSADAVTFHLRQAFRKLDVSNRAQLKRIRPERSHAADRQQIS